MKIIENKIWSDKWDKRFRWLYLVNCNNCNIIMYIPKHVLLKGKGKFCSSKCGFTFKNKQSLIQVTCAWCKKEILKKKNKMRSKSGLYFCNRDCKEFAQCLGGIKEIQPKHYGINSSKLASTNSYRPKALRRLGANCNNCNYDKEPKMLDVHHKDGNRLNNLLANLEVLCVWCHAIKSRNVGWHEWVSPRRS